ncbi:MAG: 2-hydroxyacyl-CoA dehydratase family protein [Rickettsiales bacterium]|jgi:benzoyl-CoA reductase/2-hydroxyglutaryl-CoA dehydratase subunit BcrC/BadD/HgdB|nr:2-hydroxyacyl-CoA dehydratase family protein [Rickettsiales bacterium]
MSINLISNTCDQVDSIIKYITKNRPKDLWMFEVQKAYWNDVRDAHKNGKKIIFYGGPGPIELIYAFDAVPFFLDMIPTRIASNVETTSVYIDEAEKYVPNSVCGLDKVELGVALRGDYGVKPDGFVYFTVPCDSARVCHPAIDKVLNVPSIRIDVPFRRDDRGYKYLGKQYEDFIKFMEEVTGKKMDWDKFAEVAEISNKCNDLMNKIADLRKLKPCPLPGHLLVLNEMMMSMSGHPDMLKFMQKQYDIGKARADKGLGAVKEEKYRVSWLQNMVWANAALLRWLETEYGAIVVMDGFGYQDGVLFNDVHDKEDMLVTMAKKAMISPMIHGASGPAEHYVSMVDNIMESYDVNVSMFLGHVGCKHTFAAAKMVTDMIQDKFGIPTLMLELDAIDLRYKSVDEMKASVAEYMESVVGAKRISKEKVKAKA